MSKPLRVRNHQWYGQRVDVRDARDLIFDPKGVEVVSNPDLRAQCAPVMNQGELGSCTAHGVTGALRHRLITQGVGDFPMARLQLYYDSRKVEGTVGEDSGAEIRDVIKCAAKNGVAHETLWPYTINKYRVMPPQRVYTDAIQFKALKYERVNVATADVLAALSRGFPVVVGLTLYDSFESDATAKTGVVAMPNLKTEEVLGGHCMLVVGHGQKDGYFTVRNSWDVDWGDHGDCYIPEDMIGSAKYGSDYWVIDVEGASVTT